MQLGTHRSAEQWCSRRQGRCQRPVGVQRTARKSGRQRQCRALPDASEPSPALLAAKQRLESLLAEEGIELAGSITPAEVQFSSPRVDWSRFNIQVLFVDRTDTLRARVAAGIFDRIAAWNGYGRALISYTCGLEAQPATPAWPQQDTQPSASSQSLFSIPGLSLPWDTKPKASTTQSGTSAARQAAVLSAASSLKLSLNELARPAEQFEVEDLDRYDLIVCLDRGIRQSILSEVQGKHRQYYEEKVCLLSSFSQYEGDFVLLARGGLALLPSQLSFLLRTGPKALSVVKLEEDIISPELSSEHGAQQWSDMVQALICCTAGLAKYLMDAQPDYHWNDEL